MLGAMRVAAGWSSEGTGRGARPRARWCTLAALVCACGERADPPPAPAEPPAPPPIACAPGAADCDGDRTNGCEIALEGNASHCGACDAVCAEGLSCVAGACSGRPAPQICTGSNHACFLRDRRAWCWGANEFLQLSGDYANITSARLVEGADDLVEIACAQWRTCARRADGAVLCWGKNVNGELGVEPSIPPGRWADARGAPVVVAGLGDDVASLALGGQFACALHRSGLVSCWGANYAGQLGDDTRTARHRPARVADVEDVVQIVAGDAAACALRSDGTVWCWGRPFAGSPEGHAPVLDATLRPTRLAFEGAEEISLGTQVCARRGGSVSCSRRDLRSSPVAIPGLEDASSIVATTVYETCARRAGGEVVCWHSYDPVRGAPPARPALAGIALSTGTGPVACGLRGAERTLVCWGRDIPWQRSGLHEDPIEVVRAAP
jgi:hypothetical protein